MRQQLVVRRRFAEITTFRGSSFGSRLPPKSLHSMALGSGSVHPSRKANPYVAVRCDPSRPPYDPPLPWGGFSPRCRGRLLVRASPSRPHATPLLRANRHVGMGM